MLLAGFRRGLPEHRAEALLLRLNMPRERDLGGPAATVEGLLAGLACMNGLGVEIACDGASEPTLDPPVRRAHRHAPARVRAGRHRRSRRS